MKPKFIFITSSVTNSHCKNRIEDFIRHGFEIVVYSFRRDNEDIPLSLLYKPIIIGDIVSANYVKRLFTYLKGICSILRRHNNDKNSLYFVFGLDLTLFLRLFGSRDISYIYEEADLVQTYGSNRILRKLLDFLDKSSILKARIALLTSEGFVEYHFPETKRPDNIVIVPNKLNPTVVQYPVEQISTDISHLRFAFVGGARFDSVDFFVETLLANFPQHEFHFYGPVEPRMNRFKEQHKNVFYHGRFKNPDDLPQIYKNVDLLLCTYDYRIDNVKYAEPNKLYEAIYFRKPIIVSSNTFLSKKVSNLGIGYHIDSLDEKSIISFVQNLTLESIKAKKKACASILQEDCIINDNELFLQIQNI
jgi:glycosyltransferase involved in cell wall biosynthesis